MVERGDVGVVMEAETEEWCVCVGGDFLLRITVGIAWQLGSVFCFPLFLYAR